MIITSVDNNGNRKEYNVILTMYNDEYNRDYIVYTDNKYTEDNELQIYFNEYDRSKDFYPVKEIKDKKEFNTIKTEINKILLTLKNESFKLVDSV